MANLSSKTGFTPNLTQISLANNAATTIQNMSAYDGQMLTGFVYVDATTDKRAFCVVQVIKNGAGTYEVAAADVSGDDEGGSPIVTFAMSGNNLQATLPNFAGFTSAYIRFKLDAPALGAQFPLQVSSDNVSYTDIKAATSGGLNFKENGGTTNGSMADAGNFTFGPASGLVASHLIQAATTTIAEVTRTGTGSGSLMFKQGVTNQLRIGYEGSAGDTMNGTANNDVVIRNIVSSGGISLGGGSGNNVFARISSVGHLDLGNSSVTNTFHAIRNNAGSEWNSYFYNYSSSGPYGLAINYPNATPNNSVSYFFYASDSSAIRFAVRSDGGIANYSANNVNLSDARIKKDIESSGPMLEKLLDINVVRFKYKDQTHNDFNIGVIAQQVESVAPEFVDSDGFGDTPDDGIPLKTIYEADLMYAMLKAIQEQQAIIEQLKSRVEALENA